MSTRTGSLTAAIAAAAVLLLTTPCARALTVLANENFFARSTGIQATAGQSFAITATGAVDLAAFDGPYITDPGGDVLVPPPPGSGAYTYFSGALDSNRVFPLGPPEVGSRKFMPNGFPYGALLVSISQSAIPIKARTQSSAEAASSQPRTAAANCVSLSRT